MGIINTFKGTSEGIITLSVPLNQKGGYSLLVCLITLVGAVMLERLVR